MAPRARGLSIELSYITFISRPDTVVATVVQCTSYQYHTTRQAQAAAACRADRLTESELTEPNSRLCVVSRPENCIHYFAASGAFTLNPGIARHRQTHGHPIKGIMRDSLKMVRGLLQV